MRMRERERERERYEDEREREWERKFRHGSDRSIYFPTISLFEALRSPKNDKRWHSIFFEKNHFFKKWNFQVKCVCSLEAYTSSNS